MLVPWFGCPTGDFPFRTFYNAFNDNPVYHRSKTMRKTLFSLVAVIVAGIVGYFTYPAAKDLIAERQANR